MNKRPLPPADSCPLLPPNLECHVISAQHPLRPPSLIDVKFLKTGTGSSPSLCHHVCGTRETQGKVLLAIQNFFWVFLHLLQWHSLYKLNSVVSVCPPRIQPSPFSPPCPVPSGPYSLHLALEGNGLMD